MVKLYRDIHLRISSKIVNDHIEERRKVPFGFESVNTEFVRILEQRIREQDARAELVRLGHDDDKCIPKLGEYGEDGIGGMPVGSAYQFDQITWQKAYKLYMDARKYIVDFERDELLRRRIPWK